MPGAAAAAATFSVTAIKPNPADPFSGAAFREHFYVQSMKHW